MAIDVAVLGLGYVSSPSAQEALHAGPGVEKGTSSGDEAPPATHLDAATRVADVTVLVHREHDVDVLTATAQRVFDTRGVAPEGPKVTRL